MSAGNEQSTRVALLISVAAFIVLNVGFYILSGNYFEAHASQYTPERMSHIRTLFAVSSGVIVAVNFLVGLNRRIGAHLIAIVLGVGTLAAGVGSLIAGLPGVLGVTQLVAGILMPVLAWYSYKRQRGPWAFLVAICVVFAVTDLFGAPRIGQTLSLNLWTTMIIPGLYAVAAAALIQLRGQYSERDTATASAL
jgi:hypothetical protein